MISIDTVYQRVLALANKEQRGYVTPLEYNLHANQAQQLIFEQYFYDLDQAKRVDSDTSTFSDMEELIENKLSLFKSTQSVIGGATYPSNYRTGKIFVTSLGETREAKLVKGNEIQNYLDSTFHRVGLEKNPIYMESTVGGGDIEVYNHTGLLTTGVSCEIVTKPNKVEWGYDVINERALYNASRSINYELHDSEETELVQKILVLAGITIDKQDLAQTGIALETLKIQQEKQ